ncbi:hypothetical protein J31TS4_19380 [Paenibacillus sp. J31TS4]|nr:hypothetical protein J31TS4_19380 [Paenibacillus sp. J31TS4]
MGDLTALPSAAGEAAKVETGASRETHTKASPSTAARIAAAASRILRLVM